MDLAIFCQYCFLIWRLSEGFLRPGRNEQRFCKSSHQATKSWSNVVLSVRQIQKEFHFAFCGTLVIFCPLRRCLVPAHIRRRRRREQLSALKWNKWNQVIYLSALAYQDFLIYDLRKKRSISVRMSISRPNDPWLKSFATSQQTYGILMVYMGLLSFLGTKSSWKNIFLKQNFLGTENFSTQVPKQKLLGAKVFQVFSHRIVYSFNKQT